MKTRTSKKCTPTPVRSRATPVTKNCAKRLGGTFYLKDPDGNRFQVLEADDWFENNGHPSGGVMGCTIGVSDMDAALKLYADVLGFDQVLHDATGIQADWDGMPHGTESFRRSD